MRRRRLGEADNPSKPSQRFQQGQGVDPYSWRCISSGARLCEKRVMVEDKAFLFPRAIFRCIHFGHREVFPQAPRYRMEMTQERVLHKKNAIDLEEARNLVSW
jgi:hypothetical protein